MKENIRAISGIALMAAVTAVLAPLSLPVFFSPVPVTLGVFAVLLTAALLPPRRAFFAQLVYILIGLSGIPVFAGFRAGAAVLYGPTGGFLAAYPISAVLGALLQRTLPGKRLRGKRGEILFSALALSAALLPCYLFGTLWFAFSQGISPVQAFFIVALPFLPIDLAKAAMAAVLSLPVRKRLAGLNFETPPSAGALQKERRRIE